MNFYISPETSIKTSTRWGAYYANKDVTTYIEKILLYLNTQNKSLLPCPKQNFAFELWVFLTQENKQEKDGGRFTIGFVARLFTF